jgi:hypothetical protein
MKKIQTTNEKIEINNSKRNARKTISGELGLTEKQIRRIEARLSAKLKTICIEHDVTPAELMRAVANVINEYFSSD